MALAGRSASVGVRDRVRTRNASCTPRLVHVSADGVLAAQLLTCNRAICPFLPFRALRCAARKWPVYRDFAMARPGLEPVRTVSPVGVAGCPSPVAMARPGLEPGTPRFQGVAVRRGSPTKDLQINGFQSGAVWRDRVGSRRFRGGLGLRRGLEVPMSRPSQRHRVDPCDALPSGQSNPADSTPTTRVDDARAGPPRQGDNQRRAGHRSPRQAQAAGGPRVRTEGSGRRAATPTPRAGG
jgi:hypothetical protein